MAIRSMMDDHMDVDELALGKPLSDKELEECLADLVDKSEDKRKAAEAYLKDSTIILRRPEHACNHCSSGRRCITRKEGVACYRCGLVSRIAGCSFVSETRRGHAKKGAETKRKRAEEKKAMERAGRDSAAGTLSAGIEASDSHPYLPVAPSSPSLPPAKRLRTADESGIERIAEHDAASRAESQARAEAPASPGRAFDGLHDQPQAPPLLLGTSLEEEAPPETAAAGVVTVKRESSGDGLEAGAVQAVGIDGDTARTIREGHGEETEGVAESEAVNREGSKRACMGSNIDAAGDETATEGACRAMTEVVPSASRSAEPLFDTSSSPAASEAGHLRGEAGQPDDLATHSGSHSPQSNAQSMVEDGITRTAYERSSKDSEAEVPSNGYRRTGPRPLGNETATTEVANAGQLLRLVASSPLLQDHDVLNDANRAGSDSEESGHHDLEADEEGVGGRRWCEGEIDTDELTLNGILDGYGRGGGEEHTLNAMANGLDIGWMVARNGSANSSYEQSRGSPIIQQNTPPDDPGQSSSSLHPTIEEAMPTAPQSRRGQSLLAMDALTSPQRRDESRAGTVKPPEELARNQPSVENTIGGNGIDQPVGAPIGSGMSTRLIPPAVEVLAAHGLMSGPKSHSVPASESKRVMLAKLKRLYADGDLSHETFKASQQEQLERSRGQKRAHHAAIVAYKGNNIPDTIRFLEEARTWLWKEQLEAERRRQELLEQISQIEAVKKSLSSGMAP